MTLMFVNILYTIEKETSILFDFLYVLINNKDPTNLITSVYGENTSAGLLANFSVSLLILTNLGLSERY